MSDRELGGPAPEVQPEVPDGMLRWRRIGRLLVGIEALVPLVAAAYAVLQLITGDAIVRRNEAMLAVFLGLAGLGLLFVAHGVGTGRTSVRMACLVWQALLLLGLVPALWQADRQVIALLVVALTLVTGYATVRATARVS